MGITCGFDTLLVFGVFGGGLGICDPWDVGGHCAC